MGGAGIFVVGDAVAVVVVVDTVLQTNCLRTRVQTCRIPIFVRVAPAFVHRLDTASTDLAAVKGTTREAATNMHATTFRLLTLAPDSKVTRQYRLLVHGQRSSDGAIHRKSFAQTAVVVSGP